MKALLIATTLMLAATPTATWAQAPAAGDPHHPPQAATPAPAPAQPGSPPGHSGMGMMGGMPMMNMMGDMPMMHMMHMHMMAMMRMMEMGQGMAPIDRIEGRIAFLRAELKITEAQASAWNAFADALRANAQKLGQVRAAITHQPAAAGQQQAATMAERLDAQERWLQARLEGTRALKSALTSLYGGLSDEQKKTADELLAPHMGMGMMGMRGMMGMMPGQMQEGGHEHGQMQPGQMQPGQMQPGQMQPGHTQPGQMQPGHTQPGQMQPGAR